MQIKELEPKLAKLSKAYTEATPYPHVIIDNFLPTVIAEEMEACFPESDEVDWQRFGNAREKKLAFSDMDKIAKKHPNLGWLCSYLGHSASFEVALQKLTGIDDLTGDPGFMGGGLHRIEAGGYLGIHTDFNYHPNLDKTRKVNLLLFLNKDWKDEYGGHLEMWNKGMTKCVKKIRPVFNRAVIFTIDDTSWHGHPHPLTCPKDVARKSLAFYYYSDGKPEHIHSTIFQQVTDTGYKDTTIV